MNLIRNKKEIIIASITIILFVCTLFIKYKVENLSITNANGKLAIGSAQGMGIGIIENGKMVSKIYYDDGTSSEVPSSTPLFQEILNSDSVFCIGKKYNEEIKIRNMGQYFYTRIVINKYWQDTENNINQELDSSKINIDILEENGWILDTNTKDKNRIIAYYKYMVPPDGETNPVIDNISISSDILKQFNISSNRGNITLANKYDGNSAVVEIEADAVGVTSNMEAAIESAWNVKAEINENGEIVSVSPIE